MTSPRAGLVREGDTLRRGPRAVSDVGLLGVATLLTTFGDGMFVTTGAIYLTRVMDFGATQVGLVLSIGAAAALVTATPLGRLADRVGPGRVLATTSTLAGLAVLGYLAVSTLTLLVLVAVAFTVAERGGAGARGAIIALVTDKSDRVRLRARLRTLSNVGIGVGAVVGGLALAVDEPTVYRAIICANGVTFASAALCIHRLRADAVWHPRRAPAAEAGDPGPARASCDLPFVAMTVLCGVMSMHYTLLELVLPLWIVERTQAPRWAVAVLVVLSTVIVVALQVRASRNITSVWTGARALRLSSVALVVACVAFLASGQGGSATALLLLLAGGAALVAAELMESSGSWAVSFGLATEDAQGQYQGLFSMGHALSGMVGPALLTYLVMTHDVGWLVIAGVFVVAGLLVPVVATWGLRTPPAPGVSRSEHEDAWAADA